MKLFKFGLTVAILTALAAHLQALDFKVTATPSTDGGPVEYMRAYATTDGVSEVIGDLDANGEILFSRPDDTNALSVYVVAGNAANESEPSDVAYWSAPGEPPHMLLAPGKPIFIKLEVVQ